jgi:hypothetical protein
VRSSAWFAACVGIAIVAAALFLYTERPLFWLLLLLCPAIHLWMMKNMHKSADNDGDKGARKDKRSCH